VNLFLVGFSSDPIEPAIVASALQTVASRIPYLNGLSLTEHSSADRRLVAAWICHPAERVGGVEYAAVEGDALAMFSGRPILVTDDGFDGLGSLDPRLYLQSSLRWEDRLDGRFVVVRCDGGRRMTVTTDPLGAYLMFTSELDGIRWVGNNAGAVALAARATEFDSLALASLLGAGWSFGGQPLRRSVHRLAANAAHTFQRDTFRGIAWTSRLRRDVTSPSPKGFDARDAARVLVGITDALVDWPDRPVTLALSGGRDSRLTFAAAAGGSWPFLAKTVTWPFEAGFPESGDVRVARALCEIAGIPHQTELGSRSCDVRSSAETLSALSAGMVTIGDAGTPPVEWPAGPLELQITGSGAEIARCRYGLGYETVREASEAVCRRLIKVVPAPIVNDSGLELVRTWVGDWMARRAGEGVATSSLGDAFKIEERSASWASAVHGSFEYWADTVSPAWTASLVPLMLACPGPLRLRDGFHNLVLQELSPELWRVPFAGDMPTWPTLQRRRVQSDHLSHAHRNRRKIQAELRRRLELAARRHKAQHVDLIEDAQSLVRELGGAFTDHAAWDVLNRKRVENVLTTDPRAMHPRSRQLIWRLLAVLSSELDATPEATRPHRRPSARSE
jgi:hypothetical protein